MIARTAEQVGWREVGNPADWEAAWREANPDVEPPRAYQNQRKGLTAFLGREPLADDDWRWHLSLRYGDPGLDGRVPSWEECVEAAHVLRPGVVFVIGIPPRSFWMNVHPHVLHLFEIRDEPLVASYRAQATGQAPT